MDHPKIVIMSYQSTFWYNLCQQFVYDFYVFITCLKYFVILEITKNVAYECLPFDSKSQMQVFAWQQADWIHSPRARKYDKASLSVRIFLSLFFRPLPNFLISFIFYDNEDCICTWVGMWISVFWYFLYIDIGFDIIWAWLLDVRSHSTPLILYIHLVMD